MKTLWNGLLIGCLFISCATAKKGNQEAGTPPVAGLQGHWELDLISYPAAPFDSLYAKSKPELTFDTGNKQFSGSTSCNRIHGPLVADATTISFKGDIAMTMMACPGEGESVFVEQLKRINKYAVSADGKQLTLIQGDVALMRFHRK